MRYANDRRRWVMIENFNNEIASPADWPDCDGIVTVVNVPEFVRQFRQHASHVVCCSGGADPAVAPVVCMNDHLAGRLAAQHLLDCRIEHFGYYSTRGLAYLLSQRRLAGFREALVERGMDCEEFRPVKAVKASGPLWAARPHWPALIEWLRAIPKPVGILATDDTEARELAAACLHADIAVPDQVALVGVNNDELLCESAWPPLSSVEMNFNQVGYAAARLLDRLMGGEELADDQRLTRVPPAGVVLRASTDVLAVSDPSLAEAVRFIRDHACDPCAVEDVAIHVAVTRRWLERQFVRHLGRSPHDEIVHVRMEAARRLLLDPQMTLPEVAEHCGFSSLKSFHRVFLQSEGETPAAWRRIHRRGER